MAAILSLAVASFASQALVRSADTLLPQIATDFAVTVGVASIVITAYALTHGTTQFITGPIADRFGKYRTVAVACGLSALTVAACGLARSLDGLTLARFFSGLTVAWILPISLAYIGDVVPYDQRQQVLGRFLAGQVLGQLFGQAAGGVIGDYFGWRVTFFALAAMLAAAAAALTWQLFSNPITRPASGMQERRGMIESYRIVLGTPWARIMLLSVGLEGTFFQGVFSYIGADLHLRFGVSFAGVGVIIGIFALGGLIYAATVKPMMRRLGQTGIAKTGGIVLGLAFLTLAVQPVWYFAPLATLGLGLGFYMLHNTLQTEATQMVPQARGTGVTLFASMYFLGQTLGVALGAPVMDRFGAPPIFVVAALALPALAFFFTAQLKRRAI
ncbi:MFS transporter [Rhodoplanes sp. Z2-YC6860]|uniref:MFS transporter n=1 Tax=Rhodoplanes sp. Z2-YC6860 TaxID=674703 RepID=UPI00078BBBBC|nr:MFS transporter [Rhodoplanes sp. Z2-YC6860]AMN41843.1 major facilitator superfamily protein 11 [Rhodoplanes sp. Z2-YC6860]